MHDLWEQLAQEAVRVMQHHQHHVLSVPLIALGLKKRSKCSAVVWAERRRTGTLLVPFL